MTNADILGGAGSKALLVQTLQCCGMQDRKVTVVLGEMGVSGNALKALAVRGSILGSITHSPAEFL